MYKKLIKYTDFNGVEREEEFYFNLTKGELLEMEFSKHGGYETFIRKIAVTRDTPELMQLFKNLILSSYGVKSEDGRRFIKTQELREEFEQTEAYSELLCELMISENANAAIEFITNIMPGNINVANINPDDIPNIPGVDKQKLLESFPKQPNQQPVEKPGPPK